MEFEAEGALLDSRAEEQEEEGEAGPPTFREPKNFPIVSIWSACREKVSEQTLSKRTSFEAASYFESGFEQRSDLVPARERGRVETRPFSRFGGRRMTRERPVFEIGRGKFEPECSRPRSLPCPWRDACGDGSSGDRQAALDGGR